VSAPANPFTLADWRHTVAEHYVEVRALAGSDPQYPFFGRIVD
jgi:hypothetical protein